MSKSELKEVKLADITASKTNPRKIFDKESIEELSQSIFEKGVLQPIVLRLNGKPGKYELVCGERRYRASLLVQEKDKKRDTIPAVIRELTDEEALELQIIENLQRKDVHPMEEAVAFKGLMVMKKMEVKEIALRIGKSPQYVAQRLKLNDIIEDFQKAFYQERMTIATAFTLSKLRPEDQKELWESEGDGSGKIEIGKWELRRFLNNLTDAPFDTADPSLNKHMGGCGGCPFNSASNSLLFPEATSNATCLNSECYKIKCDNYFTKELKEAKNNPDVVLVSSNYSLAKEANALINKGEKVHSKHDYSEVDKPEVPDMNEFEENLDDGDYDNRGEMLKAYNEAMKDYEEEKQAYEKKVASGKFIKAFVVEGSDKGKYIFIEWGKSKSSPKQTNAGVKAKKEAGEITADDIKLELQRVKDNEKRKKELDLEKIHFATDEIFQKNKKFKESIEQLGVEEMRGAILFLMESNYNAKSVCEKMVKSQSGYSNYNLGIYKKLEAMKYAQLCQVFHVMLRTCILSKLSPIKGGGNQRPDANGHAAAYTAIAKLYMPVEIAEIENAQMEERLKRENRVEERIKKLNKQLGELKKSMPTVGKPELSVPKEKKGVKTLTGK